MRIMISQPKRGVPYYPPGTHPTKSAIDANAPAKKDFLDDYGYGYGYGYGPNYNYGYSYPYYRNCGNWGGYRYYW